MERYVQIKVGYSNPNDADVVEQRFRELISEKLSEVMTLLIDDGIVTDPYIEVTYGRES